MKTLLSKVPYLIIAILVGFTISYAGSLTPPGAPAKTMKSLGDLYELVDTGANTPSTDFTTPGSISPTMNSLGDIYDLLVTKIGDIDGATILTGTNIFGVDGTATAGPATLTWQSDPDLLLCWSYHSYEINQGCSVGSGFIDASIAQDGSIPLGAVEYCQYLDAGGTLAETPVNYWHLPTIAEYQSITDFSTYNMATQVSGFTGNSNYNYWSSTQQAESGFSNAWYWRSYSGSIDKDNKYIFLHARCAR